MYRFDAIGLATNSVASKTLVCDMMNDLAGASGLVAEKVEGSVLLANGDVMIVNDNYGIEGSSGETWLMNLGNILIN